MIRNFITGLNILIALQGCVATKGVSNKPDTLGVECVHGSGNLCAGYDGGGHVIIKKAPPM